MRPEFFLQIWSFFPGDIEKSKNMRFYWTTVYIARLMVSAEILVKQCLYTVGHKIVAVIWLYIWLITVTDNNKCRTHL